MRSRFRRAGELPGEKHPVDALLHLSGPMDLVLCVTFPKSKTSCQADKRSAWRDVFSCVSRASVLFKVAVEQARLDAGIVLVFAA